MTEHLDLAWYDGPGPGYSSSRVEELLQSRYDNGLAWTRWTRVRLTTSEQFIILVSKLRGEGWPDWQIVSSIFTIIHSYRVNLGSPPLSQADFERRSRLWSGEEQQDWPLVPSIEFTEEAMRAMRRGNMLSTLRVRGLDCRQFTPDLPAIEYLLTKRYGFVDDDIEHPNLFFHNVSLSLEKNV